MMLAVCYVAWVVGIVQGADATVGVLKLEGSPVLWNCSNIHFTPRPSPSVFCILQVIKNWRSQGCQYEVKL